MNKPSPPWDRLPGALLPFDWGAFARKHKILYHDHGGLKATAGPMAFRLGLFALGQLGWALDEALMPGWRNANMRGPLFILGHQRSGTTFLHRLLDRDLTHARSLRFHEMLLPASTIQRAIAWLAGWDKRHGGKLNVRFQAIQEKKFAPLDPIHRLRFDEVEEDEFVLWTIYASAMCVNDSPISTADNQLDELRHFDDWLLARQIRALGFYRACLLKKVHRQPARSPESAAWAVSKNPIFTQKIPQLAATFPVARFIYLVRNPLLTIPSRLSLIRAIWRHRFAGFDQMTPGQVQTIIADSLRTYLNAERDLPQVPDQQKLLIRYEDLTADPAKTVRRIYEHFSLPGPDNNLADALAQLSKRDKPHASQHKYSLSEFGLDAEGLRERLAPVFKRYDFE